MKIGSWFVGVFVAWAVSCIGQDGVTGTWKVEEVTFAPWTFTLRAEGNEITGTVSQRGLDPDEAPATIYGGAIAGNQVSFKCDSADGGRTITFSGVVAGDTIAFTREVNVHPGQWPGMNGVYGAYGPSRFMAKRLMASTGNAEFTRAPGALTGPQEGQGPMGQPAMMPQPGTMPQPGFVPQPGMRGQLDQMVQPGPMSRPGMMPQGGIMPQGPTMPPGGMLPPAEPPGRLLAQALHRLGDMLRLIILVWIACNILLAIWIYTDIRKRGEGSGIFVALALLAGIPVAIIYSLVRIADKVSGPGRQTS